MVLRWKGAGARASEGGGRGVGVAVKGSLGPPAFQDAGFQSQHLTWTHSASAPKGLPAAHHRSLRNSHGFPWIWLPVAGRTSGYPLQPSFSFTLSLSFLSHLPSFPPPSLLSFSLKYNWFTTLCWFLSYRKVTPLYTYTFFFIFFSLMVYHRILNIVPYARQ